MKLVVDINAIENNIKKAEELTNAGSISLMTKSFYEDIYRHVSVGNTVFSKTIPSTVCYSIDDENESHVGAIVNAAKSLPRGIRHVYVPINVKDNREGVTIDQAKMLCRHYKGDGRKAYGLITSGCINANSPTATELRDICEELAEVVDGVSLGGSYYLQYGDSLPNSSAFNIDIRIGEYMLYGTIPYCDKHELFGDNALIVQASVCGVYRERGQIIVKGGYSQIDSKDCFLLSGGLRYVDSSSDYTIYEDPYKRYKIGDIIELVPNYKSLPKLQNVGREYKK